MVIKNEYTDKEVVGVDYPDGEWAEGWKERCGEKGFEVGDKVCYQPDYSKWENGIVRRIPDFCDDMVWVVYNCDGNWKEYYNYTAASTNVCDLKRGWK